MVEDGGSFVVSLACAAAVLAALPPPLAAGAFLRFLPADLVLVAAELVVAAGLAAPSGGTGDLSLRLRLVAAGFLACFPPAAAFDAACFPPAALPACFPLVVDLDPPSLLLLLPGPLPPSLDFLLPAFPATVVLELLAADLGGGGGAIPMTDSSEVAVADAGLPSNLSMRTRLLCRSPSYCNTFFCSTSKAMASLRTAS